MMQRSLVLALFGLICLSNSVSAHEMRPAYLELKQTTEDSYDILWKVPAAGDDLRLGLYVRFPPETQDIVEHRGHFVGGSFVDRWSVSHPGGLTGQTIHIDGLQATMTDVLVRMEQLDGTTLVHHVEPSDPALFLTGSPSLLGIAETYLVLGVEHILSGIDHLLFVLALLIIVKGKRRLILTITAFTAAHSVTLAAATLGWVNVPGAPVEAVITLSIVFVAAEIVHGQRGQEGLTARAPWIVALVFGLLHGFGFAGALREVGLPEHAIPLALFLFNIGVEVGQLLFVAGVLVLIRAARIPIALAPSWATPVPAYAIGTVAAFWTLQRVIALG